MDQNNLRTFLFKKNKFDYFGIYIDSWYQVDDQTPLATRSANHSVGLKSIYYPYTDIAIQPHIGYQRSENKTYIDWGWDLGFTGRIKNFYLGDYKTNFFIEGEFDLFPQRENIANNFNVQIHKQFSNYASDSLQVHYNRSRQQYYSASFDTIIDADLENRGISNVLIYSLSKRSKFQLNTILNDRRLSDNTPVNPNIRRIFRIENRFSFRTIRKNYFLNFELRTFQETQDNIDILTDSKASQTRFRTDFAYFISSVNRLDLQIDYIKYQYDTPALENYEDRDNITFSSRLRYFHKLNPLLSINLSAYINLSHKIYMARQQSANNNWDRTYKIQSSVRYCYLNWRNTLQTEVLANYIVYDFDELFVDKRSVVFRQYAVADSLNIPLFSGLHIGAYIRFELKDMGSFFKQLFAQSVLGSWQTLFLDLSLVRQNFYNLILEIGCAWYDSKNWRKISNLTRARFIKRLSPHLMIRYPLGRNLYLSGQISHHYQNEIGRKKTEFTYGRMDLVYQF